jgi:mevalonate kinase
MLVKASAPGSMMLLGEYAVLHGKQALVCAVDKRMTVTLIPRHDSKILINSSLGKFETDLAALQITPPFQFVLASLKKFSALMQTGCYLIIESEFSDTMGLGSSAAVTVATISAIKKWLNIPANENELVEEARAIIREVQGLGSGADVAASVLGGMVSYTMSPMKSEKINTTHPITAVYSGYKTKTVDAVKQMETAFLSRPEDFKNICDAIGECAQQGTQAVREANWNAFGKSLNAQQELMQHLGVTTPDLSNIITTLRADKNILGAKISGSGLGDCIIGLGSTDTFTPANDRIKIFPISMSTLGVICEKI